MGRRSLDLAVGSLVTAGLWATALVPAYAFSSWPRQIDTPSLVGVLRLVAMLGLVAGATRIASPLARLVLAGASAWVAWCPPAAWPGIAARLIGDLLGPVPCRGPCVACEALAFPAHGLPGVPGALVLVVALGLAVWRRPPTRAPDGTVLRATRRVRYAGVLGAVLGPLLGAAGWLILVPGDIYGGPLGLGILVGLFGLLTLAAHAAFHGLLGRPLPAAVLAPAYAATAIMVPVADAALAGTLRLG